MNIYVGNLSYQTGESEIRTLFEEHGEVQTVKIVKDRDTGRPRGFAFVEMEQDPGNAAIEALQGVELNGRNIQVNEAHERKPAPSRNNFSRGGSGGGGNRRFDDRRSNF